MAGTEFTMAYPLFITVDYSHLDFNGLVETIHTAGQRACGEVLGILLRAMERWAQEQEPQRWENRGQQTRRLRERQGEPPGLPRRYSRRTRVRECQTGKTYNLADRLVGLRPYVRRGVDGVRTACELAVELSYRRARHWWQRITGLKSCVMNFWRMVQQAGERRVRREQEGVGEVRPEDPPPRAIWDHHAARMSRGLRRGWQEKVADGWRSCVLGRWGRRAPLAEGQTL